MRIGEAYSYNEDTFALSVARSGTKSPASQAIQFTARCSPSSSYATISFLNLIYVLEVICLGINLLMRDTNRGRRGYQGFW